MFKQATLEGGSALASATGIAPEPGALSDPAMLGVANRRILVVDDHEMIQAGIRALLDRQNWVSRCVGASSGGAARDLVRAHEPHVALVDLLVGEESGIDVCRMLREEHPGMRVILMSSVGCVSKAVAQAAGAHGFMPKHWSAATVVYVIRRVSLGRTAFAKSEDKAPPTRLSKRETDVLQHLVYGASNAEIGAALYLSTHTVKQHTSAVYRKLGVRNRTEAASHARVLGLVR